MKKRCSTPWARRLLTYISEADAWLTDFCRIYAADKLAGFVPLQKKWPRSRSAIGRNTRRPERRRRSSSIGLPLEMTESCTCDVSIKQIHIFSGQPFRVGCSGWSIPRQAAALFASSGSHLERYSQSFNSCEINSSFYRPHKKETWERWARSVPAGFRFSVKAPRTITHEAKLNCSSEVLSAFLEQIEFLRDKLGPVLIQLPPSLEFDHARARKFLSLLRGCFSGDVVWEPRHASWFEDQSNNLLKEFHIARVAADPACVPASTRPGGLASLAYFRLHGSPRRYFSTYSCESLNMLVAQMASLDAGARVWCIFDNTAFGAAIPNALELAAKLRKL
jgi:uncharacterized protein YecE (DUF72 family)